MCGACPGGARLSTATLQLNELWGGRGGAARAARELERLSGGRLRIAVFGDGWTVALPTGGLRSVTSFEDLVEASAPYIDRPRLAAEASAQSADASVAPTPAHPLLHLIVKHLPPHPPTHPTPPTQTRAG